MVILLTPEQWRERCRMQDHAYEEEQAQRRKEAEEDGEAYEGDYPLSEEEERIEALTTEHRWFNAG